MIEYLKNNFQKLLFPLLFVILFFTKDNIFNWDKLAYMACVLDLDNVEVGDIHTEVYTIYEQSKGNPGNAYESEMQQNPNGFYEQLGFYRIRVLYNAVNWVLYKIGIPLGTAVSLNSLIFTTLLTIVLFRIAKDKYLEWVFGVIILTLILFSFFNPILCITTPDAMFCFFMVLIVLGYLDNWNRNYVFLIMLITILVRTDSVILSSILLGLDFLKKRNILTLIKLSLLAITFIFVNNITGYLGWNNLIYHTFVELQTYPKSYPKKISIDEYWIIFKGGLFNDLLFKEIKICLIALPLFFISIKNFYKYSSILIVLVMVISSMLLRYILFPIIFDRFNLLYIILILVCYLYICVDNRLKIKNLIGRVF
ncbi:hypothetical protein PG291_03950 [Riemerella anatipestifer]|nr:hypothetical protein [Riemerella anatipestifer]